MTLEGPGKQAIVKFGGASFLASDVKSKHIETDKFGHKTYVIDLVNGTKLSYPEQAPKNNASVLTNGTDAMYYREDETEINRFFGLEVTTGKPTGKESECNRIVLEGSSNCNIDTSNNNAEDYVVIRDDADIEGRHFKSQNNRVLMDKKDSVREDNKIVIDAKPEGTTLYREGQAADRWDLH